jgi:hypothetical protein
MRIALALLLLAGCGGGLAVGPEGSPDAGSDAPVDATTDTAAAGGGDAGSPMDAGAADTPAEAEPDACGDTQSDPSNCGVCGNDCLGGPCFEGSCGPRPTVLAMTPSPTYVAVAASTAYWVDSEDPPAGAAGQCQILSCDVGGCNGDPETLWNALYPVGGLAVEQGSLWWPVGSGPTGHGTPPYGLDPQILSCSVIGCAKASTLFSFGAADEAAFTADDTNVYWVENQTGTVSACALTGCSSPLVLATDTSFLDSIAVGPAGVYWVDESGLLQSCPKTGCTGTPFVIGTISGRVTQLAADAVNVYFIDPGTPVGGGKVPITQWLNGAVRYCPLSGCTGDPTVLVSYPSWLAAGAIGIQGGAVYWTTEDGGGTFGQVVRCPVTGCGGQPYVLGSTTGPAATVGLALDANNVYWSDPGLGAVLSTPL